MAYEVRDKTFHGTKALPTGASAVNSDGFDLGLVSSRGHRMADFELFITIPPLTVAQLADTKTLIVDVQCDADSAFGSPKTIAKAILTVTGVTAVDPSLKATVRYHPPSDCERYLRVVVTHNNAIDISAVLLIEELLF